MLPIVYINMRFLTQRITGVQRFAYAICCELDRLALANPQLQLIGLLPRRMKISAQYPYEFKAIQLCHCGYLTGHLWEQVELAWHGRQGLLLNLCNSAPVLKLQQMITLHDVIFMTNLDSQKWWFKLWYRVMAQITSRTASRVYTVSAFSAQELKRLLPQTKGKIKVLGNAPALNSYAYVETILARLGVINQQFYVLLGSNSRRKNTAMVAKLFVTASALQQSKLVIIGGTFANLAAVQPVVGNNLLYSGYLSDGELRCLLKHAAAFIFPSLYEGFGIPVLEAMNEGTLVLVADIPVLHEVCAAGAYYFSPQQPAQLLQLLTQLERGELATAAVRSHARMQVAKFCWHDYAASIYADCLEMSRG